MVERANPQRRQQGQGKIELALMLMLVAFTGLLGLRFLGTNTSSALNQVTAGLSGSSGAPLTYDALWNHDDSIANADPMVVSGITTSKPELLVAFITSDGPLYHPSGWAGYGASQSVTSVTTAGLTWKVAARANPEDGTAEVWYTIANGNLTNASVSVTRSYLAVPGCDNVPAYTVCPGTISVAAFSGYDPVQPIGGIGTTGFAVGQGTVPTVSLMAGRTGSQIWGVGLDCDTGTARTVGANQTLIHEYSYPGAVDDAWVQRLNGTTTTPGLVTLNDTAPVNNVSDFAAVEIRSAGGSGSLAGTLSMDGSFVHTSLGSTTDGFQDPLLSSPVTTFNNNELLVLLTTADGPGAAGSQSVTGVTTPGLVWNFVTRANSPGYGDAEVWYAIAATPLTAATVRVSHTATPYEGLAAIYAFSSYDTGTPIGASSSGGAVNGFPTLNVNVQKAKSNVLAVGWDWTGNTRHLPAAGQTILTSAATWSGDMAWVQAPISPVASPGVITLSDTTPNTDQWNFVGVEIRST